MRITFGVGIGFDKDNKPIPSKVAEACIRAAMHVLSEDWGGVFITRGQGGWVSPSKRLIVEDGVQLTVETDDAHKTRDGKTVDAVQRVRDCAEYLRKLFNQNSVIASVSQSETFFQEESADVIPFPIPVASRPLQGQA